MPSMYIAKIRAYTQCNIKLYTKHLRFSFYAIRIFTASAFVASLYSRNFLGMTGQNALVRTVLRLGLSLLLLLI